MDVTVSAAEVAARFKDGLQRVLDGRICTGADQGRPMAKIAAMKAERAERRGARQAAFKLFRDELAQRATLNLPKMTRDTHEFD